VERPLLEFVGEKRAASIGKFEKFDDQIMGGMSQSAILSYGEGEQGHAAFTGVVRVEGGGFCGSRMKLLNDPMDLSAYAGLYIKAQGDGKTYKLNCRTTPTAGESIYQAEFTPPEGPEWSTIRIPWTAFRLVKRAVPVEGAPPLPATTVYQLGFVLSKFSFGEDDFNDKFSAGSFRLKVSVRWRALACVCVCACALVLGCVFVCAFDELNPNGGLRRSWLLCAIQQSVRGPVCSHDPAPISLCEQLQELGVYEDAGIREAWVDTRESTKGEGIEIKDDAIIQDSMKFKPNGKKRSWWSRILLGRVRGLLRKRVAKRRSDMAEELLAKRKEGKKLSQIRSTSWQAPAK